MDITPISNEAFAILAECEETKKPFGITVDPKRGDMRFVWAFKIDKAKAHREGFDGIKIRGTISLDANFNGCPHCATKRFYICDNCFNFNRIAVMCINRNIIHKRTTLIKFIFTMRMTK